MRACLVESICKRVRAREREREEERETVGVWMSEKKDACFLFPSPYHSRRGRN